MTQSFEAGQYRSRVTRWSLSKAKTGTAQFALTFLPLGRINVHNPESELLPCAEAERTIFRAITDKTSNWLLQDLAELFGYTDKRFSPLDPESQDAFSFADKEFTALLEYEDYCNPETGEVIRPNVERWRFANGNSFTGEPMSTAEVRQLDTLYGCAKPRKNHKKRPFPSAPGNEQPQPEAEQEVSY